MRTALDQSDKPSIIEGILTYYKKGWEDYSLVTLMEHLEDIKTPIDSKLKNKMNKEQLINILLNEDKQELNSKSYIELKRELFDFQTKNY